MFSYFFFEIVIVVVDWKKYEMSIDHRKERGTRTQNHERMGSNSNSKLACLEKLMVLTFSIENEIKI